MNTFLKCHRSSKKVNTSASEHLVSHVTTHEHLVEIVQYSVSRSAYTYRERVHNPVRTSVTIPWIHCTVNCDQIMPRRWCPGEIDTRGDRCRRKICVKQHAYITKESSTSLELHGKCHERSHLKLISRKIMSQFSIIQNYC